MLKTKQGIFLTIVVLLAGVALFFSLNKKGRKQDAIPPLVTNSTEIEAPPDSLAEEIFLTEFFDLESAANLENVSTIKKGKAFSGTQSSHQSPKDEFGVTYSRKLSAIDNYQGLKEVIFSCRFFAEIPVNEALAVLSVDGPDGKSLEWFGEPIKTDLNSWQEFKVSYAIKPSSLRAENTLKLYVWNKTKNDFYTDDMRIELKGMVKNVITPSVTIPERNISNDFEVPFGDDNPESFSTEVHKSGTKSFVLDSKTAYSPSVVKRVSEVIDSEFRIITLSSWIYPSTDDPDVVLVVSLKDPEGKEYSWHGRSTDKGKFPAGEWTKHRAQFKLPFEKIKPEDIVSAYVWNKSGDKVFIDDLEVVFGETNVRGGGKPVLDMTVLGDSGYTFPKNIAPFRRAFLTRADIGNKDSHFLIQHDNINDGEMNSFQPIVAGNLIKNAQGTQQLFTIVNGTGAIYSFCASEGKFNKNLETSKGFFPSWCNSAYLSAADFNGDGIHEIFITGAGGDKAMIVSVMDGLTICAGSPEKDNKLAVWWSSDGTGVEPGRFVKGSVSITGDFDGNRKADVFSFNPQMGDYRLTGFSNKLPEDQVSGLKSEELNIGQKAGTFSVSRFRPAGATKDLLLIAYRKSGRTNVKLITLNESNSMIVTTTSPVIPDKFISSRCSVLQGQFTGSGSDEMLIYNSDWRFELKLAISDSREMVIKNELDFKGFARGLNPKFYESIKILTGRFTQGKYDEVIVIANNCDDPGFDGVRCKTISKQGSFPPSVQLYHLSPSSN